MIASSLSGCGTTARHFGGDMTIDLPQNEKLVNFSWDSKDSLWYLTRDMDSTDTAHTYKLKEDSNFGVMQGTVTIKEHKQ